MSVVHNVILITAASEARPFMKEPHREDCGWMPWQVDAINKWIEDSGVASGSLIPIHDEGSESRRHMEIAVHGGGINYLQCDELIEMFRGMEWEYPEIVTLIIKREHNDHVEIYRAGDRWAG